VEIIVWRGGVGVENLGSDAIWVIFIRVSLTPGPSPRGRGETGGISGFLPSPSGRGAGGEGKHITHIASLPKFAYESFLGYTDNSVTIFFRSALLCLTKLLAFN